MTIGDGCQKVPTRLSLEALQLTNINDSMQVTNSCKDLVGSYTRTDLCPDNGEFQIIQGDACTYDGGDAGNEWECWYCGIGGWSGHCPIAGFRTKCKRTSYSADPLQCCLKETAIVDNKTCDPKYRSMNSGACDEYMTTYCSDPNLTNFFSPKCRQWLKSLGANAKKDTIAQPQCNKIRGLGPATFTNFRGNKIKISKVDLSDLRLPIGEILVKERDLFIGTADVALKVLTLTPAGKREQSGFDFANGARLSPGEKVA